MQVVRSNRMERLVEVLAGVMAKPPADPIVPECLVVQSRGMAQWLQLELASRLGIVANVEVIQPRQLVERVLRAVLDDPELRLDAWTRERLTWVLMERLPELVQRPSFEELRQYLAEGGTERRFALCQRLANLFDQYAVFRPELVLGWEEGQGSDWQAELWRDVVAAIQPGHLAALAKRAASRVAEGVAPKGLPERALLVGMATLPPLYLQVLQMAQPFLPSLVLVLAPTKEFASHAEGDDRYPPLLRALGRVGREFQSVLEDISYEEPIELWAEPEGDTLLARLQGDLLALRSPDGRGADGEGEVRAPVAEDDASVEVIGAHTPLREVEALRDALWARLEADPTLLPEQIVVMTPDLSVHGPLIEATFGVDPSDPLYLPFSVADRPLLSGNEVARALLALLVMVGAPPTLPAVVDLAEHAPLREAFGLSEDDRLVLPELLSAAGVRWGWDGDDRREEGLGLADGGFQAGLDRLLLGAARSGSGPWAGVVPVDGIEGDRAEVVGRIAAFVEGVADAVRGLARERPVGEWAVDLLALVGRMGGEHADIELRATRSAQAQVVRARLDDLRRAAAGEAPEGGTGVLGWEGFGGAVSVRVVVRALEGSLTDERSPGDFLRAGITVCEMLPMRAIPFRVVAVLGLSDGAFPRNDVRLAFDQIAASPRPGDRSRRHDDRSMMLEAILSAREALIITAVTRQARDNRHLPPSVVLLELLDVLTATAGRPFVVRQAPLQPFSADYAAVGGPFAADALYARGATALVAGTTPASPWVGRPVGGEVTELTVDELDRFLRDPRRWYWDRRLRASREVEVVVIEDRERLEADALARWQVGDRYLRLRQEGLSAEEVAAVIAADGLLPPGALGLDLWGAVAGDAEQIVAAASPRLAERRAPSVPVALAVDGPEGPVRVVGQLGDRREGATVRLMFSDTKRHPGDALRWWLRQALGALAGEAPADLEVYGRHGAEAGLVARVPPIEPEVARGWVERLVARVVAAAAVPPPCDADLAWAVASGQAADEALTKRLADEGTSAAWARWYGEGPVDVAPLEDWASALAADVVDAVELP